MPKKGEKSRKKRKSYKKLKIRGGDEFDEDPFLMDDEKDDYKAEGDTIKNYSLKGKQKCTIITLCTFIFIGIGLTVATIAMGIITFSNVNNTTDLINSSGHLIISDNTTLSSPCGSVDLINGKIIISSDMELNSQYLNVAHFSQKDPVQLGSVGFGEIHDSGGEARENNELRGIIQMQSKKKEYSSGLSIGYYLSDFSTDSIDMRCPNKDPNDPKKKDQGSRASGWYQTYVVVHAEGGNQPFEVYLCNCIHVTKIFGVHETAHNSDLFCRNEVPESERATTIDQPYQERCVSQGFCYNWYEDNLYTSGANTTEYNICGSIPIL